MKTPLLCYVRHSWTPWKVTASSANTVGTFERRERGCRRCPHQQQETRKLR